MNQQEKEKEYEAYVKEKTPVRKPGPAMAKAFVTGGIICTAGQAILNACEKAGMSKDISASWSSGTDHRICQFGCGTGNRIQKRRTGFWNRL